MESLSSAADVGHIEKRGVAVEDGDGLAETIDQPMASAGHLAGTIESNFCKYKGKPRRISVVHADKFKKLQNTYQESVDKALKTLNPGKLVSMEYLYGDSTVD